MEQTTKKYRKTQCSKWLHSLNPKMRLALRDCRKRKLEPLRLIHPEHLNDQLYKNCYKRFFRSTGITCTRQILSEVAKMPSLLGTPRIRCGDGSRVLNTYRNQREISIEAPEGEIMEHINNTLNMLKPTDFDAAGFDENDSSDITEEKLIDCVHQNGQLVLLNQ